MEKKQMLWKTKGMNQDLSVSAFNPEFAFENMNLRLSTNEHNTLMSWVNEKGTQELSIDDQGSPEPAALVISGIPIGTAIINHQLVIFTTDVSSPTPAKPDKIYLISKKNDNALNGKLLYEGNLGFDVTHPLETLVSYESNFAEKVYWVDGKNQPRVINLKATLAKQANWTDTSFDFVPALGLKESIKVSKNVAGGGLFAPGVIQYGFTYINKYGQESNMVMVSPLHYLSHVDRGASPEEKVTDSLTIDISNVDQNFDYLRIYSIQRTSLDSTPIVKLIEEFPTERGAYSEEYVYNEDIIYYDDQPFDNSFSRTLPVIKPEEEWIRVESLKVTNGTYVTNFTSEGYDNSRGLTSLNFYGYTSDVTDTTFIMTLQELMFKRVGLVVHIGYQDNTSIAYVQLTSNVKEYVLDQTAYTGVTLQIEKDGEEIDYSTVLNKYLIYDFINQRWYLEDSIPTYTKEEYCAITYTDNGTTGSTVDPTSLLFVGGKEITALTMTEKDKTLFLGNIQEKNEDVSNIQTYFDNHKPTITFVEDATVKQVTRDKTNGFYSYQSQIKDDRRTITTFKGGEIYRFGFQLQKVTGEWSEPIYLNDVTNHLYPDSRVYRDEILLPFAQTSIPTSLFSGYKRIRPLIVYPTIGDRKVLCQGVLNPTIFNVEDRKQKLPFAQASWYFRPYLASPEPDRLTNTHNKNRGAKFTHFDSLPGGNYGSSIDDTDIEVQGAVNLYSHPYASESSNYVSNNQFFVDQSIVTLNSPDIDFDTEVQSYGTEGLKLRIIGAIPITGGVSSHQITASSSMVQLGLNNNGDASFGSGDLPHNTLYENANLNAGNRMISNFLWNDAHFKSESTVNTPQTARYAHDFLIYPWQRRGPLNNDFRSEDEASSWIKTKKESNLLYSINTEYFRNKNFNVSFVDYGSDINCEVCLTENDQITNVRLPKQIISDGSIGSYNTSEINYYPNIDKILTTTRIVVNDNTNNITINYEGYPIASKDLDPEDENKYKWSWHHITALPIPMRYKSTSHAVISLKKRDDNGKLYVLPYGQLEGGFETYGKYIAPSGGTYPLTFWDDIVEYNNEGVNLDAFFSKNGIHQKHNWLWLGELYKESSNPFGGTDKNAIMSNTWMVGGDALDIPESGNVTLRWTEGDTYYQRYDCLKTYPFTQEDTNQLVEILSFMVETHVNIDGRYDKNRGQQNSYVMTPQNFNLLNPIYSQKDNFFTYKKTNVNSNYKYPNQIAYSLTKTSGADVDLWTNVNLGSTLELDGDKGDISKLERLNDKIIAFQERGISQILYNENVQVSTESGVPIEIANSGKVQGARYISNEVGCSNKWSVVSTPSGIYFADSYNKNIYLLGDGLKNISSEAGFNSWSKQMSTKSWNPDDFNGLVTYFDKQNQDVLFIGKTEALAWSEKLGTFTSFYDYGSAPYFCNLDDWGLWINKKVTEQDGNYKIWRHRGSNGYCNFFGCNKPYYMVLVGNQEPQLDKTFTNLEFRACVDGEMDSNSAMLTPFDNIECWNEYQHGNRPLAVKNGLGAAKHEFSSSNSLNRKFRIWRCDIPRDNATVTLDDQNKGIYRTTAHPLDRMRNPWLYIKMLKNAEPNSSKALPKAEIHDFVATYFV